MNTKREHTSALLKEVSRDLTSVDYDPYYSPSGEDMRDARKFHKLSLKNDRGTLTPKEAQDVCEMFEGYHPNIVESNSERWVETL